MRNVFYPILICGLGIIGSTFYLTQNSTQVSEVLPTSDIFTTDEKREQTPSASQNVSTLFQNAPSKKLKDCDCCIEKRKRARAFVKQKRKALEVWAREMIATHGYEEGMKRVKNKSAVLAERIRKLIQEETDKPTNPISRTTP